MNIIKKHINWKHQLFIMFLTGLMAVGGFILFDFVDTDKLDVSASSHCVTEIFKPELNNSVNAWGHYGSMRDPADFVLGYQYMSSGIPPSGYDPNYEERSYLNFQTQVITDSRVITGATLYIKKLGDIGASTGTLWYVNPGNKFGWPLNSDAWNKPKTFIGNIGGGQALWTVVGWPVLTGSVSVIEPSQYVITGSPNRVRFFTQDSVPSSWGCSGSECNGYPPELHVTHCDAQPNYISQNLTSSPSSAVGGQIMSFTGTVRNDGLGNAAASSVTRLRIDIDNNGSWDVTPTNQTTTALTAGGIEVETWSNVWTAVVGTHRYQVCADNGNAIVESDEGDNCTTRVFTVSTPPFPTVTTTAVSSLTTTSATLNGSANPNGQATTGWFRYSTGNPGTCNDSSSWAGVPTVRVPASGGDSLGNTGTVLYDEPASGLNPGVVYYYCAIASNGSGTGFGSVISFTTPAYTISGFLYEDLNSNSIKDPGETGTIFAGATVKIDLQAGGTAYVTIADSSGYYVFSSVADGNYYLVLQVPAGYNSNNNNIPFSCSSGTCI